MKECTKCKLTKPLTQYHKDKKFEDGLSLVCKECVAIYGKEHRSKSVETRKENQLRVRYKLTYKQVEDMYMTQEGKCAICGTFKYGFSRLGGLVIDHDHISGKVRALLCTNCNILLGRAKDNIDLLQTTINYLVSYK